MNGIFKEESNEYIKKSKGICREEWKEYIERRMNGIYKEEWKKYLKMIECKLHIEKSEWNIH